MKAFRKPLWMSLSITVYSLCEDDLESVFGVDLDASTLLGFAVSILLHVADIRLILKTCEDMQRCLDKF